MVIVGIMKTDLIYKRHDVWTKDKWAQTDDRVWNDNYCFAEVGIYNKSIFYYFLIVKKLINNTDSDEGSCYFYIYCINFYIFYQYMVDKCKIKYYNTNIW